MSDIASIVEKKQAKISFAVDRVETAKELLPITKAKSYLEEDWKVPLIAFSHNDNFEIVAETGNHPLATAIHLAFSQHRPLLLTPDIIWMTIAQGFAQHINNKAESLRNKFVGHQDKVTLKVFASTPTTSQEWSAIVSEWGLKIREHIDPKLYQLMLCDFTTTTETISTASKVVMMNAFQQYFDYRLVAICGIPEITLLGTIEDWTTIRDRVQIIAQYDLQWWTDRLLPICEGFIDTAAGNPNLKFWQHIYKPKEVYGGDVITGWLADIFPYLKDYITHKPVIKNSILAIPRDRITINDGIRLQSLPTGLSEATITLEEKNQEKELELIGGFIGITQDSNKCLYPEIGWGIREKDRLTQLINTLANKQQSKASPDWSKIKFIPETPKELIQLTEKLLGKSLYPDTKNSWYLQTPKEYKMYELVKYNQFFTSFAQLKNKRYLACSFVNRTIGKWQEADYQCCKEVWIVVTETITEQDDFFKEDRKVLVLEKTKVIAKGITQLLERIITAEGKYYFDNPSFIPDESLDTLDK